jgi:hypothetical protein
VRSVELNSKITSLYVRTETRHQAKSIQCSFSPFLRVFLSRYICGTPKLPSNLNSFLTRESEIFYLMQILFIALKSMSGYSSIVGEWNRQVIETFFLTANYTLLSSFLIFSRRKAINMFYWWQIVA